MKPLLAGILIGCILVPLAGFLYLRFGYVPVAVDGPVIPFEQLLAGSAIDAKIAREAPKKAAIPATEANLIAGAKIYRENCVECHGLKGQPETVAAKGMFPPPPQFFEHLGQGNGGEARVGENYWIVANGVRLTGMPGYKGSLRDEQIWQVSQFVENRGNLPPSADAALSSK